MSDAASAPSPAPAIDADVAEILLLLALDDASGRSHLGATAQAQTVGAAGLAELVLLGRLRFDAESGRLVAGEGDAPERLTAYALQATDRKPSAALARVVGFGGGRAPATMLQEAALERLREEGALGHEETRFLGATWAERWPRGRARTLEDAVQAHARALLTGAAGPADGDRVAAALTILHAAKVLPTVFPDLDRDTLQRCAEALAEGSWAGDAVRAALQELQIAAIAILAMPVLLTMNPGT